MKHIKPHPDYDKYLELRPAIEAHQELALDHGIADIYQDNGGKLLQTLLILNLKDLPGRAGNDAFDDDGNEYELKSVNMDLTYSVSTHHHLNPGIIEKYRAVTWLFSIYEGITLIAIYQVSPDKLEPLFEKWEAKYHDDGQREINNPKIPLSLILRVGTLCHGEQPVLLRKPARKSVKVLSTLDGEVVYNRQPTASEKVFTTLFEE